MDKEIPGLPVSYSDRVSQFEHVFKTQFRKLHDYAWRILKDEAAAEEMVQQVFYKLWERPGLPEGSLTAYLYRAVHNESLNYLKHQKVKAGYEKQALTAQHREDAKDNTGLRELREKIDLALNELPEQCRTVFQLSRFEELKYREIADKLGISVKTVENHMGKALKILRNKLSPYLPLLLTILYNLKK